MQPSYLMDEDDLILFSEYLKLDNRIKKEANIILLSGGNTHFQNRFLSQKDFDGIIYRL